MANGVLLFFLFVVFSLAVSVMGSLFCAGLCAIRYDIVPRLSTEPAGAAGDKRAARWTTFAGLGVALAAFLVFHLASVELQTPFTNAGFLGLVFGLASVQLSFVPLILAPLVAGGTGGTGTLNVGWAFAVMIIGSAVGLGLAATGLVTGHESWLPFVVPASLGSAVVAFFDCVAFAPADRFGEVRPVIVTPGCGDGLKFHPKVPSGSPPSGRLCLAVLAVEGWTACGKIRTNQPGLSGNARFRTRRR